MNDLPHHYKVAGVGPLTGRVSLLSTGAPYLATSAPPEFGGPGDMWSPETLLTGAVASCFVLTFRAVARAASLSFVELRCDVDGTLDRIDGGLRFTTFALRVHLTVHPGCNVEEARALLLKAERGCLISRSLSAPVTIEAEVTVDNTLPRATEPPRAPGFSSR